MRDPAKPRERLHHFFPVAHGLRNQETYGGLSAAKLTRSGKPDHQEVGMTLRAYAQPRLAVILMAIILSLFMSEAVKKITGRYLNEKISLGAAQARYHKDGRWFDQLHKFPGALFDCNGYVLFPTRAAYERCPDLRHPRRARADGRPGTLDVPNGISAIRNPAYVQDSSVAALYGQFSK